MNAGRQPGAQACTGDTHLFTFMTCQEVEDENDDEDENDWGRKEASRKSHIPIDISRPSKIAVQTTQKSPLKPGPKIVTKIPFKTYRTNSDLVVVVLRSRKSWGGDRKGRDR